MDTPLFDALRHGDRYALEELISRHGRWVRGLVYAQLAETTRVEDVLQCVWMRVWEQAGSLRDARTWRAWLCRLARNAAYDEVRRQCRERKRAEAVSARVVKQTGGDCPDRELTRDEQTQLVAAAIRALPAIYREPLVLRHVEGWSYGRIADVLDMPVDTVETRLVRARRLLREALGDKV